MAALDLPPDRLVTCYQIHSADVATVETPWRREDNPRADALVTNRRGAALGILTADCVPVLFADPDAAIIGAAHAGWKGALGGVVEATVAAMTRLGAEPGRIRAAIGPCIAQRSYEVGPEFPAAFLAENADNADFFVPARRVGHFMFDLASYVERRLARAGIESSLEDLRDAFDLEEAPNRLECFDISHTGGTDTVASCVVFGVEGPLKNDYRRFNISGIQPGDDYAAMYQALTRRYKRIRDGEIIKPDVLLIDGGKGQLAEAAKVLDELGVEGITLIGVAKGVDRRAGQEQLFLLGQDTPTILAPDSRALHLIQRVRDEAHRFAIAGHRRKRAKRHSQSILETIPGLGPVKRRELLKQFGGLQGILRAGIDDFIQVRGLGRELAQVIYEHLHPGR